MISMVEEETDRDMTDLRSQLSILLVKRVVNMQASGERVSHLIPTFIRVSGQPNAAYGHRGHLYLGQQRQASSSRPGHTEQQSASGLVDECLVPYEDPWLVPFAARLGIFHAESATFLGFQGQSIVPGIIKGGAILGQIGAFPDVFGIDLIDAGLFHELTDQIVHFLMG